MLPSFMLSLMKLHLTLTLGLGLGGGFMLGDTGFMLGDKLHVISHEALKVEVIVGVAGWNSE